MGIAENLRKVEHRIERACADVGRDPAEVRLLPVSKFKPAAAIVEARAAGYRRFGENRVQEVVAKSEELGTRAVGGQSDIEFAVIGHLQTNKAKQVAHLAAEFQALDTLHLARELDKRCEAADRVLDVLVQVNSSGEESKSGLPPADVLGFARQLVGFEHLNVRGLMTLALPGPDPVPVLACFDRMLAVQRELRDAALDRVSWDELSMGMTDDLELAISRGSTCVRVGRAIFGAREPLHPQD